MFPRRKRRPAGGRQVSPSFETLEPRQLLSGGAGAATVPADLPARGFVRVAWEGQEVYARPGQWLMQFDRARGNARQQLEWVNRRLARAHDGLRATAHLGADGLVRVSAPEAMTAQQLRRALRGVAAFRHLEPDVAVWTAATVPSDPSFGSLWGMHNTGQTGGTADADIDAPEAWDLARGDGSVVVAVIDTGVDYTHPDLAANVWRNPGETPGDGVDNDGNGYIDDVYGWDFFNGDADPMDDDGHGTHVAGTLAAAGNNSAGVVGVNWKSKVMALKFLGADGTGSLSDAVAAINYATKMRKTYGVNVRVTNNSWGTDRYSSTLYAAVRNSELAGILTVAAAGNGGSDGVGDDNDSTPMYPASFDIEGVIAVAATDHNDRLASFSNYGDVGVDLAAPGVSVLSTVPGGSYARLSGTSMATPHVAGVAALAWSYSPGASHQAVRSAILSGADAKASLSGKVLTGARLNAHGALRQLPATAPAAPAGLSAEGASDSRVDLTWADNSGNEQGFRVYRSTDGSVFTLVAAVGADVTTYADTGLAAGTTYFYRVTAYNAAGESAASNADDAPTHASADPSTVPVTEGPAEAPPAAPGALSAAVSSGRVDLAWADNSGDEDGFRVYRSNDGVTFSYLATAGADVTAFGDTDVVASATYYYSVRAYNAAGESADSNTASAVLEAAPPAAPGGLTATIVSRRRIDLGWTDNSGNEDGFTIERSRKGVKWTQVATVGADETAYSAARKGRAKYFRVRAHNATGASDYSNVARITKARVASAESATEGYRMVGLFSDNPVGGVTRRPRGDAAAWR